MNILAILAAEYPGITPSGGAGTMMRDLLESLVERGWDARVSLFGNQPPSLINGVKVNSHEGIPPDVVITHLGGSPRARREAERFRVPLVHLVHNTSEATVGFLAQNPDFVIFNSNWVRSYHETRKRSNKRNPEVWPSVVVRPPALDFPVPLARPGGKVTLVNLVANKGTDVFYCLAEAFPEQEFLAVQGGYEQEKQLFKYLPNVEFRNYSENLNDIYGDTSILVVPSIYESYSRCAVEAMSRGIPVIASNTLGLQECLGGIPTYPRKDFGLWCKTLEGVIGNWEEHSNQALLRATQLWDQTHRDLRDLDTALKELL